MEIVHSSSRGYSGVYSAFFLSPFLPFSHFSCVSSSWLIAHLVNDYRLVVVVCGVGYVLENNTIEPCGVVVFPLALVVLTLVKIFRFRPCSCGGVVAKPE